MRAGRTGFSESRAETGTGLYRKDPSGRDGEQGVRLMLKMFHAPAHPVSGVYRCAPEHAPYDLAY